MKVNQTTTSSFFSGNKETAEKYRRIFEQAEKLAKCKKCERVIYAGNLCKEVDCPKRKQTT